jgi:hypothetical protein
MEQTLDDLTMDDLECGLCELAAHIAAAQYRWLRLLAEFDRRRGWADWGIRSCAHWLNWKCGLDLRSAREKIRVARALDGLPLTCEAFSRGEISYSKVRAITRIATPETEPDLLMFARHGTTQHVEKIVRGYRRSVTTDEANDRHDKRYLGWRYDEDGSLVIKARLDPEEGALLIEAIEKERHRIAKTRRTSADGLDGSAEPPCDRADALVELARRELSGHLRMTASGDRYTVMVHANAEVLARDEGACHLENGSPMSAETVKRLTCDGSIVAVTEDSRGSILDVGRKTRTIPSALRRALRCRDGCCRFPGCANSAFVDGHHIKHWSKGGETSLDNLVLLCTFHHRLLHEGGVSMRVSDDGRFTFIRRDGRIIETATVSVEPNGVERRNAEAGLQIDASTVLPRWYGDACDYSVAIAGLASRNGVGIQRENGSAEPLSTRASAMITAAM